MVRDINSGSYHSNPDELKAIGLTLYFQASNGYDGYELYTNSGVYTEVTYS